MPQQLSHILSVNINGLSKGRGDDSQVSDPSTIFTGRKKRKKYKIGKPLSIFKFLLIMFVAIPHMIH